MRKLTITCTILGMLLAFSVLGAFGAERHAPSVDPVVVVESTAEHLVLGVNLPESYFESVEMLDGNVYAMFSVEGGGFLQEGKPDVPVFSRDILIPNGKTAYLIVYPGAPGTSISDILLSPLQQPMADLEDASIPGFVIDEAVYGSDAEYPGIWAELGSMEMMRGQKMAQIRLYPYQYNPVQRTLTYYPNLSVEIIFEGDIGPIPAKLKDETFEDLYRRNGINANEILAAEEEAQTPAEPKFGPYGWDYLIFSDPAFEQAANTLAAWKKKSGYSTLVTIVPKNWKAEDIKGALLEAYSTWDIVPKYVLLIGDAEHIAPFYRTWHVFNSTKYKDNYDTQGFNGTDIYYSTLESGGMLPDEDLKPEVLLGRLPVETPYQAMDLVNAIIHYEQSPPSNASFYNDVIMAAQFQDGGEVEIQMPSGYTYTDTIDADNIEDRRYTQTSEDIAIFLGNAPINKNIKRMYYAETNSSPQKWNDNKQEIQSWNNFPGINTQIGGNLPSYLLRSSGFPWNADSTAIKNAINAGSFLITHRDHGGRMRWSQPRLEGIFDVGTLTNQNLLPVVWSFNCQTGWFDNETDFKGKPGLTDFTTNFDENFAEMWFRTLAAAITDNDYGAVGVVAPTRVTYGGYNERLFMGMIEAIWPQYTKPSSTATPLYKMGEVINHGKEYMSANTTSGVTETIQLEGYHWFGDPTMQIRTQKPPLMIAMHDPEWRWALHPHPFNANVQWIDEYGNPAGPVPKAKVTLTKADDPNEHWTATTDEEGNATIPELTTHALGEYEIVVTAANHLPYSGTLLSLPGSAGGIALDAEVYRCGAEIVITLADYDLRRADQVDVHLTSSNGDEETVWLYAVEGQPGYFRGGMLTEVARPDHGDGILQVVSSAVITAIYEDVDDGSEGTATVEDTAVVDCDAPIFGGLYSVETEFCSARLSWDAAFDLHGLIIYEIYRDETPGAPYGEKIGETWALSTMDEICGHGATYYYLVRARDAVGNQDDNTEEHSARFDGIWLPLVYKQ